MDKEKSFTIQKSLSLLYWFALFAHIVMLILFLIYKVKIMFYFNIVSVVLYLMLGIHSSIKNNTKVWFYSVILAAAEVVVHQMFAIVCLGSGYGFQYFLIMLSVMLILQPQGIIKSKTKIIWCFLLLLLLFALELHISFSTPIYTLPTSINRIILLIITVVSTFGIMFFAYEQWSIGDFYRKQSEKLLNERENHIQKMQEKIISNFADILEKRDGNTGGHIKRTSEYVKAIIDALIEDGKYKDVLTEDYSKMVVSAAPLHDIGKISISDNILCKKGKLTGDEYSVMKTHSKVGDSMLKELLGNLESEEYVSTATDISRYHHEKWNGTGYPDGKKQDEIPLAARIMAVADVFDALTSERCYKEKYSLEEAYKIMESESGEHFDPVIIDELVRIKSKIKNICEQMK